jgi:hypothetical protein
MVYNVMKSIKLTWPNRNIKENLHQLHYLMCYFLFLQLKNVVYTHDIIHLRNPKQHLWVSIL